MNLMIRQSCTALLCVGIAAAALAEPTTQPTSQPCATTQPTSARTTDPAAMTILAQLEQAGRDHPQIRAEIDYEVVLGDLGDTEQRTGWVAYRDERPANDGAPAQPARFRVHFDTLRTGGPKLREVVDYAFDGQWLTVAKHKIKQMTRYQVVAKGERVETMRLGQGPFPLPFGQKADEVLDYFEAHTRPARPSDPKGTQYLRLTTRPERLKDTEFTRIEMWIDDKTHLPVRIVSKDKKRNLTTASFKNVQTDKQLADEMFHMARPAGWQLKVERLGE